ncbi:hypothetical protein WJX72_001365 [[Myrmecia] bisecta]|uniref:Uncharacterized protein n=1 Tax=[Myrmecia] bisecta TaxID=41462 RepID=A0AAW1R4T9_9CHLO
MEVLEAAQRWRRQDMEQRMLDNARVLWDRFVEHSRVDMEEHAEYLRGMATLAALVAGFVMMSFFQFSFDPTQVPRSVLLGFVISNALTVAFSTCCMAMCALMLASTFKTYTSLLSEDQEAAFILQCRQFALRYKPGDRPPAPRRTFRKHWETRCQDEWRRALYMFVAGIGTFLANMSLAVFIKFWPDLLPAILMTVPLGLGFGYFYARVGRWTHHLVGTEHGGSAAKDLEPLLESLGLPFDWHLPPRAAPSASFTSLRQPAWDTVNPEPPPPSNRSHPEVQWREEDMQQRQLGNARVLWRRFIERERNDVEQRAEQLRSFSFLSSIIAGFAVSSLLQLVFDTRSVPFVRQVAFSVTVSLTAALMTCSMTMCSLIHMSILKAGHTLTTEADEAQFMAHCHDFATRYQPGDRPPQPRRTFRMHWDARCKAEWRRAFYIFSLGLAMFQANVIAAAWIKYIPYSTEATVASAIVGAGLLYLLLAHGRWVQHLFGHGTPAKQLLKESAVAVNGLPFAWHLAPLPGKSGRLMHLASSA